MNIAKPDELLTGVIRPMVAASLRPADPTGWTGDEAKIDRAVLRYCLMLAEEAARATPMTRDTATILEALHEGSSLSMALARTYDDLDAYSLDEWACKMEGAVERITDNWRLDCEAPAALEAI